MQNTKGFINAVFAILVGTLGLWGVHSVQKGQMLHEHGLITEAKEEYINVIFSFSWQNNKEDQAEAYYRLGAIALDEKHPDRAARTWDKLIKKFPESEHAQLARNRINDLSEYFDEAYSNPNKTDANPPALVRNLDAQVEVTSVTPIKRLTVGKLRSVLYISVTVKNVGNKTAHHVTCRAYNEKNEEVGFTFLAHLKDIPPGKSASNYMIFYESAYHKQFKTFKYTARGLNKY